MLVAILLVLFLLLASVGLVIAGICQPEGSKLGKHFLAAGAFAFVFATSCYFYLESLS